ncbi:bifunctional tRNA (5-methylaminomethyl-2-thiouridine)(34)-methyltransferase MnmD/FAD-dependent 5-carboxymethylaminomethyl-2-thiouridine(34) oxidoreductase MnmC [Atopomonas sediminilitoris]|uniref:bifunctional tRNA (5-methylaminomethyl-2-thiouridine)(34)-methyltransferase MnmD/FAD-dependent 5-carboxymethylaminomethyl-2-thiouridine(34) oxidoreductase MnmC n=1 Tax=Atopomonas sediminilitoris TaxID=2919919 RepID=UPI001F4F0309|nr:bifunctional tRNA (5-methylaminomethyl-2-thiouridine)(34)-methyltransferase MnmD/FAD-dependent 5-carboxymethylaminomethyl-2-thiouridine(34) oxidoreductase MnmC [Atopomonas sediminilitoris]MCJ8169136.1 bifunctional tRNA (5-methylaminomethyl-2-thiouridine)(34)-methyltransferase MnmD/FAD-dependent 5-carboxymethylaminomethyl-2-thiouridine(34) oxidoreductase MnmC [Atopomonas sediminilitoris]
MRDFKPADLHWNDQGQPISARFDDVYFSTTDGLAESRYVFLQHNRLAERFAALQPGDLFSVGETGFGSGLNFLCTWQCFEQHAPQGARLHFFSAERYPLTREDLRRALALWPELAEFAAALLAQYQALHQGYQTLHLAAGRISLTLLMGDALPLLRGLSGTMDAWFLDGFAPAKNPGLWQADVMQAIAKASRPGSTLATFACTSAVRKALEAAGFAMHKAEGFGLKREMLYGHFVEAPPPPKKSKPTPWFAAPPTPKAGHALVLGAGLSGCATANALARRGWQVDLLEQHAEIAQEASGNRQGIMYLKLSAHLTPLTHFVLSGYGYSRRLLEALPRGQDAVWDNCGVIQLASAEKEPERQAELAAAFPDLMTLVDAQAASKVAGVSMDEGGLLFPEAGWANPAALSQHLIDHPNITLHTGFKAEQINNVDEIWHVSAADGRQMRSPVLVLANAVQAKSFAETAHLPHKAIRGQVTHIPPTAYSQQLKTVLCGSGYTAPVWRGLHNVGASFVFKFADLAPTAEEHVSNLAILHSLSSTLAESFAEPDVDQLEARVGVRCTSPDYLPLVGPVAVADEFCQRFAKLRQDAFARFKDPCPWHLGLYVNTGHGSRGLISAPFCGELLAAQICGEPLPASQALLGACHPNRFLHRDLVKRKR